MSPNDLPPQSPGAGPSRPSYTDVDDNAPHDDAQNVDDNASHDDAPQSPVVDSSSSSNANEDGSPEAGPSTPPKCTDEYANYAVRREGKQVFIKVTRSEEQKERIRVRMREKELLELFNNMGLNEGGKKRTFKPTRRYDPTGLSHSHRRARGRAMADDEDRGATAPHRRARTPYPTGGQDDSDAPRRSASPPPRRLSSILRPSIFMPRVEAINPDVPFSSAAHDGGDTADDDDDERMPDDDADASRGNGAQDDGDDDQHLDGDDEDGMQDDRHGGCSGGGGGGGDDGDDSDDGDDDDDDDDDDMRGDKKADDEEEEEDGTSTEDGDEIEREEVDDETPPAAPLVPTEPSSPVESIPLRNPWLPPRPATPGPPSRAERDDDDEPLPDYSNNIDAGESDTLKESLLHQAEDLLKEVLEIRVQPPTPEAASTSLDDVDAERIAARTEAVAREIFGNPDAPDSDDELDLKTVETTTPHEEAGPSSLSRRSPSTPTEAPEERKEAQETYRLPPVEELGPSSPPPIIQPSPRVVLASSSPPVSAVAQLPALSLSLATNPEAMFGPSDPLLLTIGESIRRSPTRRQPLKEAGLRNHFTGEPSSPHRRRPGQPQRPRPSLRREDEEFDFRAALHQKRRNENIRQRNEHRMQNINNRRGISQYVDLDDYDDEDEVKVEVKVIDDMVVENEGFIPVSVSLPPPSPSYSGPFVDADSPMGDDSFSRDAVAVPQFAVRNEHVDEDIVIDNDNDIDIDVEEPRSASVFANDQRSTPFASSWLPPQQSFSTTARVSTLPSSAYQPPEVFDVAPVALSSSAYQPPEVFDVTPVPPVAPVAPVASVAPIESVPSASPVAPMALPTVPAALMPQPPVYEQTTIELDAIVAVSPPQGLQQKAEEGQVQSGELKVEVESSERVLEGVAQPEPETAPVVAPPAEDNVPAPAPEPTEPPPVVAAAGPSIVIYDAEEDPDDDDDDSDTETDSEDDSEENNEYEELELVPIPAYYTPRPQIAAKDSGTPTSAKTIAAGSEVAPQTSSQANHSPPVSRLPSSSVQASAATPASPVAPTPAKPPSATHSPVASSSRSPGAQARAPTSALYEAYRAAFAPSIAGISGRAFANSRPLPAPAPCPRVPPYPTGSYPVRDSAVFTEMHRQSAAVSSVPHSSGLSPSEKRRQNAAMVKAEAQAIKVLIATLSGAQSDRPTPSFDDDGDKAKDVRVDAGPSRTSQQSGVAQGDSVMLEDEHAILSTSGTSPTPVHMATSSRPERAHEDAESDETSMCMDKGKAKMSEEEYAQMVHKEEPEATPGTVLDVLQELPPGCVSKEDLEYNLEVFGHQESAPPHRRSPQDEGYGTASDTYSPELMRQRSLTSPRRPPRAEDEGVGPSPKEEKIPTPAHSHLPAIAEVSPVLPAISVTPPSPKQVPGSPAVESESATVIVLNATPTAVSPGPGNLHRTGPTVRTPSSSYTARKLKKNAHTKPSSTSARPSNSSGDAHPQQSALASFSFSTIGHSSSPQAASPVSHEHPEALMTDEPSVAAPSADGVAPQQIQTDLTSSCDDIPMGSSLGLSSSMPASTENGPAVPVETAFAMESGALPSRTVHPPETVDTDMDCPEVELLSLQDVLDDMREIYGDEMLEISDELLEGYMATGTLIPQLHDEPTSASDTQGGAVETPAELDGVEISTEGQDSPVGQDPPVAVAHDEETFDVANILLDLSNPAPVASSSGSFEATSPVFSDLAGLRIGGDVNLSTSTSGCTVEESPSTLTPETVDVTVLGPSQTSESPAVAAVHTQVVRSTPESAEHAAALDPAIPCTMEEPASALTPKLHDLADPGSPEMVDVPVAAVAQAQAVPSMPESAEHTTVLDSAIPYPAVHQDAAVQAVSARTHSDAAIQSEVPEVIITAKFSDASTQTEEPVADVPTKSDACVSTEDLPSHQPSPVFEGIARARHLSRVVQRVRTQRGVTIVPASFLAAGGPLVLRCARCSDCSRHRRRSDARERGTPLSVPPAPSVRPEESLAEEEHSSDAPPPPPPPPPPPTPPHPPRPPRPSPAGYGLFAGMPPLKASDTPPRPRPYPGFEPWFQFTPSGSQTRSSGLGGAQVPPRRAPADTSALPRPAGQSQEDVPRPRRRLPRRKRKNRAPPPPPPSDGSDSDPTSPEPVYVPGWARPRGWNGAPLETKPEEQEVTVEGPGFDLSLKCTLGLLAALAVRSVVRAF